MSWSPNQKRKRRLRSIAKQYRERLIQANLWENSGYLLCCWCSKEMVLAVTELDGITYHDYNPVVVKSYSIHDTCTIEHLYGMEIEDPNGEGCLDLACHHCNTTRGDSSNIIKPYLETKHSPFEEKLSDLRKEKAG